MSSDPSHNTSPSNSQTRRATLGTSEQPQPSPTSTSNSEEAPQAIAGTRSRSSPPRLVYLDRQSITSHPRPTVPQVFVNNPPVSLTNAPTDYNTRQGRSLVARHLRRGSTSQPARRSINPYTRPSSLVRAQSQPRSTTNTPATNITMSSASSSPGNTSTAGAGSGSNPSYQLPYAPFPYPMPANGRGGQQQGGNGGSGK